MKNLFYLSFVLIFFACSSQSNENNNSSNSSVEFKYENALKFMDDYQNNSPNFGLDDAEGWEEYKNWVYSYPLATENFKAKLIKALENSNGGCPITGSTDSPYKWEVSSYDEKTGYVVLNDGYMKIKLVYSKNNWLVDEAGYVK